MAKKKEEENISLTEFQKFVDKEYGEGVSVPGSEIFNEKRIRIPSCPSIDIITSGGFEEGSWIDINGKEKTGKTTLALQIAANAQRPEYGGRVVIFSDVERRLTEKNLCGIKGLNIHGPQFRWVRSVKGRILTSEDHLNILKQAIKTIPGCVCVCDSVSALCHKRELESEGVGVETRGAGAKLFSQFVQQVSQIVAVNKCIFIGMTHVYANTSGWGAAQLEKASRRFFYQYDYHLKTIRCAPWLGENKRQIGLKPTWKCSHSKLGPPGMVMESHLRFDTGYDRLYELIKLGITTKVIGASGAWYSLDFLEEPQRFQGGEKLYKALLDSPEWSKLLEDKVLGFVGLSELATAADED